eukprot:COSAG05_NODE_2186_length_3428_cov_2.071493_2_plen_103_part_00
MSAGIVCVQVDPWVFANQNSQPKLPNGDRPGSASTSNHSSRPNSAGRPRSAKSRGKSRQTGGGSAVEGGKMENDKHVEQSAVFRAREQARREKVELHRLEQV